VKTKHAKATQKITAINSGIASNHLFFLIGFKKHHEMDRKLFLKVTIPNKNNSAVI
jgi:hypothetical protein